MFCCTLLYVHASIAIICVGKRELVALLNLSSWCLVMVECLFLAVPWGCLRFVIVVFPDHTHYLFLKCFSFIIFINLIICLHISTFRSQAAIDSENSIISSFSYIKSHHLCQVSRSWECLFWRRFFKGFYHILAWRPSWSSDKHHINKFSFL